MILGKFAFISNYLKFLKEVISAEFPLFTVLNNINETCVLVLKLTQYFTTHDYINVSVNVMEMT